VDAFIYGQQLFYHILKSGSLIFYNKHFHVTRF
jgi:hypothetical protein